MRRGVSIGLMQTVVINNKEGMIVGQLPHTLPKEKGEKGSNLPTIGEQVVFMPGANLVNSEVLKVLRANKTFELNFSSMIPPSEAPEQNPEKVGRPILVVVREVEDKSPLEKIKSAKECESIIKEMFLTDVLQRWLDEEGRSEVRAIIEVQLRAIRTGESGNTPATRQ